MKRFLILFSLVSLLTSCGGTTVKVRQSSDGVSATISVETSSPTSVQVTPSVSISLDDLKDVFKEPIDSVVFPPSGELSYTEQDLVRFHKDKLLIMAKNYDFL